MNPRTRAAALVLPAVLMESAAASAPASAAGQAVQSGGVTQMIFALLFVLGLVAALAWLLKRYSGIRSTGSGLIRVIGGTPVGQRERIVLVEVGGTWLVVGVAPGQVRALHSMPKMESANTGAAGSTFAPHSADGSFATWLRRIAEKREHE